MCNRSASPSARVRLIPGLAVLFTFAVAAGAWQPRSARADATYARAEVQAEFIERFTLFVDWPATALPPNVELVLCVLGKTEVARHLARIAGEQPIKQRRAVVRPTTDARGCHVLFVAPDELVRQRELLAQLRLRPILTITEVDNSGRSAAIINLFVEQGKQRFAIDVAAAKASGLQVRSRLLRLAKDSGRRER